MGVTGPSEGMIFAALALAACGAVPLRADQAADALATVNHIASALSDDNPADAMAPFEKSFPDFDKLAGYFEGLVDRALITSEVQVLDEHDRDQSIDLVVQWTIDLSDRSMTGMTEDRTGELHVHLVKQKGKWKVANLSPVAFFDPQRTTSK